MRVRVAYTVGVSDDFRRQICRFYGKEGLATREEVRRWFEQYGDSMSDDLWLAGQIQKDLARPPN